MRSRNEILSQLDKERDYNIYRADGSVCLPKTDTIVKDTGTRSNHLYKLPYSYKQRLPPSHRYQDYLLFLYKEGNQLALSKLIERILPSIIFACASQYTALSSGDKNDAVGLWGDFVDMVHDMVFRVIKKADQYIIDRFSPKKRDGVPKNLAPFDKWIDNYIRNWETIRAVTRRDERKRIMTKRNDYLKSISGGTVVPYKETEHEIDQYGLSCLSQIELDVAYLIHQKGKLKKTQGQITAIIYQEIKKDPVYKNFLNYNDCKKLINVSLLSAKHKLGQYKND